MERLPTEILELVLEDLVDFRDSENASKTCKLWSDILHPLKSSWMFGNAFPMIFEQLSKHDILQCRLVCRQWCFGVDHFLENNAYHRPAAGKLSNYGKPKTDLRLNSLETIFRDKKLDYNYKFSKLSNRDKLVSEAATHSRCPIVGRSLSISEYNPPYEESNLPYLEIFGSHILFLKIVICMNPVESLDRILKLLFLVPNLKSLRVEGRVLIESETTLFTEQLSKFVETFSTSVADERRSSLPKLETLQIFMTGVELCKYWSECLVTCLSTEKLQSLHIHRVMNLTKFQLENLVDLSIKLKADVELEIFCRCTYPRVKRLSLLLDGHVQSHNLLEVITRFGTSLRNLELNFLPAYFSVCGGTHESIFAQFGSYTNLEFFKGRLTGLKRVTFNGLLPPSLNFLLGLSDSLEYLDIPLEWLKLGWQHRYVAPVTSLLSQIEALDLLDNIQSVSGNQTPFAYDWNVWEVFWKLKVLTLNWQQRDSEFRRDSYEKYKDKNLTS